MPIFLDNHLTRRLTCFMARFLALQKTRCSIGYTAGFLARAGAFGRVAGRSAVLAASLLGLVFVGGAPSQPAVAQSGPALNSLTGEGSEPPAGEATDNPTANLAVLRFVTGDDFPPFHYRDEDNVLTGFNVDVARAICLQLDLTCDIKVRPWEKLMDALDDNSADAVIASLAQTPATVSRATFTDPYYFTPARFAANLATQLKDMSVIGLEGATVGVVRDTAHEAYLRTFFKDTIIKRFDTAELARAALKRNQIPLLFGDGISLTFWLHGTSSSACCDFRGGAFGDPQFFGPGVAIALSQGAPDLKLLLNQAIGDVRRSGRLEELFLRYFPLRVY